MDPATVEALESFFAGELCIPVDLLHRHGIYVIANERRSHPVWHGFLVPLLVLVRSHSVAVSITPEMLSVAQEVMYARGHLHDKLVHLQAEVAAKYARAKCVRGRVLYCQPSSFTPFPVAKVEMLDPSEPEMEEFRVHFDGQVFVSRSRSGQIAAWAAIKLKGEQVNEISVHTDPRHRGKGLAKQVVSTATAYILTQGKIPMYVQEEANAASSRVASVLGYTEFAREAFCSVTDVSDTGIW